MLKIGNEIVRPNGLGQGVDEEALSLSFIEVVEEGSTLFPTTPAAAAMEESGLAAEAFARSIEGDADDDGEEPESDDTEGG